MTKTIEITMELVEEIKKTYFVKLGYTNAIQAIGESKAPVDLVCRYGEACHEHQLIGERIIAKITEEEGITGKIQSWECNFDNNTFTINY